MEKEQLKKRLAEKELELKQVVESGDAAIRVIEEKWEFQRRKNIIDRENIQDEIDELVELIGKNDDSPTEILTADARPASFVTEAVEEKDDSPEPQQKPKPKPVGMFSRFKQSNDVDDEEEGESEGDDEDDDDDGESEGIEFL